MNNTKYVNPKQSAYCPECSRWPQQERIRNHAERLCSSGHTFTLKQSREAEAKNYPEIEKTKRPPPRSYRTMETTTRTYNEPDVFRCQGCGRALAIDVGYCLDCVPAPAPRIDDLGFGTPREQAERIVKAWRATDQHDQLLAHYIRQAIQDNVDTALKLAGE